MRTGNMAPGAGTCAGTAARSNGAARAARGALSIQLLGAERTSSLAYRRDLAQKSATQLGDQGRSIGVTEMVAATLQGM
jgi:hypothetical protein